MRSLGQSLVTYNSFIMCKEIKADSDLSSVRAVVVGKSASLLFSVQFFFKGQY